ncbi:EF-hand domain-containing protein [Noviherbaspirillum malthae]|jgi:Ca2+-binding EF-hand superfamily protein|uniref:EF-hand domain-containing protein n=1 Tax=Noviherbaspirillum malthae TaxID=1260987 RepID=UPI00188FAA69|nr:EF-hand domain-containing protein [Noviherbaspirillum malthae]
MQFILACMAVGTVFGAGLAIATEANQPPATEQAKPLRYLAKFDERFKAADKDGDGALSRKEAENAHMDRVLTHFQKLDLNGDGKLTREEVRALLRSRLSS